MSLTVIYLFTKLTREMHRYNSSYLVKNSGPWIDQTQDAYQFLLLNKISESSLELQINSLNRKDCFNLSLLNDFSAISEVSVSPDSYRSPVLNNVLYTLSLILKNTEANHVNLNFNYQFDQRSLKNHHNPLNLGLKNKKNARISLRDYEGNGIREHVLFFNKLMKSVKLSSLGFESFPLPQFLRRTLQGQRGHQSNPPRLTEFGLRLAHLAEVLLQDSSSTQFFPQFTQILSPFSSMRYRLLPSHLPLHTLSLNPLQITQKNIGALFEILKVATHLQVLTIGLQEVNETKLVFHEALPTNLSVKEFNLLICDCPTDEILNASLKLFLEHIDSTFPSLTKFSLGSYRKEFSYPNEYSANTVEFGSYLCGLSKLKHLQAFSIDTDICRNISLEFLGSCKALETLKIRMNSVLESAKITTFPENLKDFNVFFHPIRHGCDPHHQELLVSSLAILNEKNDRNESIETFSLMGAEIYSKAANLVRFCSLIKLSLVECRISEDDLSKMLNYEGLVSLRELCLSRTLLVDAVDIICNTNILKLLGKSKVSRQLEALDLSEFRLAKTIGVAEECEQNFDNLRKLEIQNNNLQLEGLRNVIFTRFPRLEELNIENIDLTSDAIINFLTDKLKYISHIKCIYLSYKCYTVSRWSDPRNVETAVNRFVQKSGGLPRIRMSLEPRYSWNNWGSSNADRFIFYK